MSRINFGVMSSNRDDWETPQSLFDALNGIYDFTLDPCSTHENAKCERHYTREDDGLSKSWAGERVFCNPPYAAEGKKWIAKCAEEAKRAMVIALLPARTDVRAFHQHIYNRPNVRMWFLRGRLKFELGGVAQSSAPFPSMLVAFGRPSDEQIRKTNELLGGPYEPPSS